MNPDPRPSVESTHGPSACAPPAVAGPKLKVPFFDVSAANRNIDVLACLRRVLDSNHYVLGREVEAFESEFAAFLGSKQCVAVGNGTDALELGLRAVGVKAGQKVLQVANAGFYAATATHAIGAQPLYVDVSEDTQQMDPADLQRKLTLASNIGCVVITHLYGLASAAQQTIQLVRDHGIPLIEDCAQAHGAKIDGRYAGTFGDVGCFSFYPTKNLGAIGDGGAVVCQNSSLGDKLRRLRQYGWSEKYRVSQTGGRNSRLDELQAAVLRQKLPHLHADNADRRRIAAQYNDGLHDLPMGLPPGVEAGSAWHLYVLRHPLRGTLAKFLQGYGIQTAVHYPYPDHLQPAYTSADKAGALPVTEMLAKTVLSLPCYPGMEASRVQHVIASVRDFFRNHAEKSVPF